MSDGQDAGQSVEVVPRPPSSALSYLWWKVCLHSLGVWRFGPLGYYRFRRDVDAALERAIRDDEAQPL